MNRRILLVLATALAVVAVLLAVSGGFRATAGGLRISARSPWPAAIAASFVVAVWYVAARRSNAVWHDLDEAWAFVDRRAVAITAAIAIASGAVAAFFGTFSASGADASGYLSEAQLFASRQLFFGDALATIIGGGQASLTSPLGWRPAPLQGFQSPTYPPGLPMLMAIPHWAGGTVAACGVVIASAAIAVWSAGAIALRMAGGTAGIAAAVTLAVTPVFIFQSVQPMSDVPVTAAWMVCWLLLVKIDKPKDLSLRMEPRTERGDKPSGLSFLAGLACAIAVLIRPNLAPLAVVPLALASRSFRRAILFSLPIAVAGMVLLWLQWRWYGSPFRSGYGTVEEIFAVANIGPNLSFYSRWLLSTTPIMMVAVIGVWLVRAERASWALAAFAVLNVLAYLAYAVFQDWSYLRFLLPALAVGSVFVGVMITRMIAGVPVAARAGVLLAAVLAIAAAGLANARALGAFDLGDHHHRVVQLGGRLDSAMAPDAVIVAGQQSGSMRYYTGRPIVRWEAASAEDLTRAVAALQEAGRPVWIVLDAWEHELFRQKFAGVPSAALDWPPAVLVGTTHRTTAWQLADRAKFMRGESVATTRLP